MSEWPVRYNATEEQQLVKERKEKTNKQVQIGDVVEFDDLTKGRKPVTRQGWVHRIIPQSGRFPAMVQIAVLGWQTKRWKRLADVRNYEPYETCPSCDGDGFSSEGGNCSICNGGGKVRR